MAREQRGFLLLEGLLAAALVAIFAGSISGLYLSLQRLERQETVDIRARYVAHAGIELARSIRDSDSPAFVAGVYGIATTSGEYIFFGSSDTFSQLTRIITVAEKGTNTYSVQSSVFGNGASKMFATYLTRWREPLPPVETGLEFDVSDIDLFSQDRRIRDIFVHNTTEEAITITNIDVSWVGGTPLNTLNQIRVDNVPKWSGLELSPATLDITDTDVDGDDDVELQLRFTLPIQGASVTITLHTTSGDISVTFLAEE